MNSNRDTSYIPESFDFEKKTALYLIILLQQKFSNEKLIYLRVNPDEKTKGDIDIRIRCTLKHYFIQVKSAKKIKEITLKDCCKGIDQLYKRFQEISKDSEKYKEIKERWWLVMEGFTNDNAIKGLGIDASEDERINAKDELKTFLNDSTLSNFFLEKLWIVLLPARYHIDITNRAKFGSDYEKLLGILVINRDLMGEILDQLWKESNSEHKPNLKMCFKNGKQHLNITNSWNNNKNLIPIDQEKAKYDNDQYDKNEVESYLKEILTYNKKLSKRDNEIKIELELHNSGNKTAKDITYWIEFKSDNPFEISEDSYGKIYEQLKQPVCPMPHIKVPSAMIPKNMMEIFASLGNIQSSFPHFNLLSQIPSANRFSIKKINETTWKVTDNIGDLNPCLICSLQTVYLYVPYTYQKIQINLKTDFGLEDFKAKSNILDLTISQKGCDP